MSLQTPFILWDLSMIFLMHVWTKTDFKQSPLSTISTKETTSGFVRFLGMEGRQDVSTVHTVPLCSPKSFHRAVSPYCPLPVLLFYTETADSLWDIEFQDLEMGHTTSQASHGLVLECSFSSTPATCTPLLAPPRRLLRITADSWELVVHLLLAVNHVKVRCRSAVNFRSLPKRQN